MRCERLNVQRRGFDEDLDHVVRCETTAADQIRDSRGVRMGLYCGEHSKAVVLHPGWTRESLAAADR